MIKKLVLVLVVVLFLSGCRDDNEVFQLIVGEEAIDMTVHEDMERIQDDLIVQVKPLWDELVEGESKTIQCKHVMTYGRDDLEKNVQKRPGESVEISTTRTCTGIRLRFFKNRGGESGLETLDLETEEKFMMLYGKDVDWDIIEYHLRENEFDIGTLEMLFGKTNSNDKK